MLVHGGTLLAILATLVLGGVGLPVPEDIVVLTAGGLIHRQVTELWSTVATCACGVLGGDLILFCVARHLGGAALRRPLFSRLLPKERRERLQTLFERRGGIVVLVARQLAGVRAPVFAMAGLQKMRLWRFLAWDALGFCISAPLFLGLGYLFSRHLTPLLRGTSRVEHAVVVALVVLFAAYALYAFWRSRKR